VEGNRLYGHGVQNMKGGVAAMISAAEAVRRAGVALRGDLVVACVAGETQGGEGTHHLVERGVRVDGAVLPEPFGLGNLVTVHGGIVHLAIHTYGVTGHISQVEKTVHAVHHMARVIQALQSIRFTFTPRADLPALPRLNVGSVIGGRGSTYVLTEPPYVPDLCTAIVDVHFVPGQTVDSIVADIRRAIDPLRAADPQLRYEIEVPPPAFFRGRRRLVMEPVDVPTDAEVVRSVASATLRIDPWASPATPACGRWPSSSINPVRGGRRTGRSCGCSWPRNQRSRSRDHETPLVLLPQRSRWLPRLLGLR
jgi:acetylornithine deacetylase